MADSDVTAILAKQNSFVLFSTGAIEAHDTGSAYLDVSTMDGSKVLFIVECASTLVPTVVVADGAEYSGGSIGDLEKLTSASAGEYLLGPLETSRFKDSNGYIKITKSTADAAAVYVRAILLP